MKHIVRGLFVLVGIATTGIAEEIPAEADIGAIPQQVGRQPWHPQHLIAVLGDESGRKWDMAGRGFDVRPDGRQLAAGGHGVIYLWDSRSLRLEGLLRGLEGAVEAVRYARDGDRLISVGHDKSIRVWDLSTDDPSPGTVIARLPEPPSQVAWSSDGTTLVAGDHQKTRVLHFPDETRVSEAVVIHPDQRPRGGLTDDVKQLAELLQANSIFSAGSATLAVSTDGTRIATASGGRTVSIETESGGVATTTSSTVAVWRVGITQADKQWAIEDIGYVATLAFSPDGRRLAIGTHGREVHLFDIAGELPESLYVLPQPAPVHGLCFDRQGKTLAVAAGSVRLWHLDADAPVAGREAPLASGSPWGSSEMEFSPDGTTLFYLDGVRVRRWEIAAPFVDDPENTPFGTAHSVALTPDGRRLLATIDRQGEGRVVSWSFGSDTLTPSLQVSYPGHRVDEITVSPDGRQCVFSVYNHPRYALELRRITEDGLQLLDVADLETEHPGSFWCTAFRPDGAVLASGHRDGWIRTWDIRDGRLKLLGKLARPDAGGVGGIDYSPSGEWLASVDWSGGVNLWRVTAEDLQERVHLGTHSARAYSVRFSPDGRLLASGDFGGEIKLWDLSSEPPQAAELVGHTAHITSLDFAPDGRTLLSAGSDGRVVLWELSEKKPLHQWHFPGRVGAAKLDRSGRLVVSANGNGTIYVWQP